MTELVRRAVALLRGQFRKTDPPLEALIEETKGIWTAGDGLSYHGTCQQLWDTRELHLVSLDYGGETREVGAIDVNIDQDLVA